MSGVTVEQVAVADVRYRDVVVWESELWMVRDVRHTAMTSQTNEVWMILEDYPGEQPLIDMDIVVTRVVMAP